ncbi:hypothetical protein [Psychroserpens sp.]|uniref:hypothetical protein n=1 Tax=Psychroserpens sp. TaxID=2020870 RepID=UPI00385E3367
MKIGPYIFSILLALLIILNSTKVTISYTYYTLDPIGFIEALCENKDKPELACNGKCHLAKVSKSLSEDQNTPENIIDFKELTLYHGSISEFVFHSDLNSNKLSPTFFQNLYSFSNINDCFHPPRV